MEDYLIKLPTRFGYNGPMNLSRGLVRHYRSGYLVCSVDSSLSVFYINLFSKHWTGHPRITGWMIISGQIKHILNGGRHSWSTRIGGWHSMTMI